MLSCNNYQMFEIIFRGVGSLQKSALKRLLPFAYLNKASLYHFALRRTVTRVSFDNSPQQLCSKG